MIKPLVVNGCCVEFCPGAVAAQVQILVDTVDRQKRIDRFMLEVPVCAQHAEIMESTKDHPGASFYVPSGPRIRRVVLVDPQGQLAGQLVETDDRRRWPTYQELHRTVMSRAEAPR